MKEPILKNPVKASFYLYGICFLMMCLVLLGQYLSRTQFGFGQKDQVRVYTTNGTIPGHGWLSNDQWRTIPVSTPAGILYQVTNLRFEPGSYLIRFNYECNCAAMYVLRDSASNVVSAGELIRGSTIFDLEIGFSKESAKQSYSIEIVYMNYGSIVIRSISVIRSAYQPARQFELSVFILAIVVFLPMLPLIVSLIRRKADWKQKWKDLILLLFCYSLAFILLPSMALPFLGLMLVTAILYFIVCRVNPFGKLEKADYLIIVFILISLISAAVSANPGSAFGGSAVFIAYFLAYIVAKNLDFSREYQTLTVQILSISLFCWLGFSLYHYLFLHAPLIIELFGTPVLNLSYGQNELLISIFQYGSMGAYLTAIAAYFIFHNLVFHSINMSLRSKLFAFATVALAGIVIYLTGGRGALLFLGLGLGISILMARRWLWLTGLLICGLILIQIPNRKIQQTLVNLTNFGNIINLTGRLNQYNAALEIYRTHNSLIGVGLVNFKDYYKRDYADAYKADPVEFVHNGYIGILTETGAFGVAAFYSYVLLMLVLSIRSYFRKSESRERETLTTVMMFGFLTISLFDSLMYNAPIGLFFWLFLGLSRQDSFFRRRSEEKRDILLFASDCFSEDRNASLIGAELMKLTTDYKVMGASLVSEGEEYKRRGFEMLVSSPTPPSGGFSFQTVKGFFADLFSGSLIIPLKFIHRIRENSSRIKVAIVVGDVFLVFLTRRALYGSGVPVMFYIHSKTDYIEPHYGVEEAYLRKACSDIFARDELTASNMRAKGIDARFFGSVIMDDLTPSGKTMGLKPGIPTVGLLPGTRAEALENMALILRTAELIAEKREVNFILALVGSLKDDEIENRLTTEGWRFEKAEPFNRLVKGKAVVAMGRGVFIDIVEASIVLIGLTGAANEQAAGLGKPVVAFIGTGAQTTKQRFADQQKLLGESLVFVENYPDGVVESVLRLLDDENERNRRGQVGRERMGEPGGAKRIAEYVCGKYLAK